jgi:Zn-dependent M16 (insulinase) family peptidase
MARTATIHVDVTGLDVLSQIDRRLDRQARQLDDMASRLARIEHAIRQNTAINITTTEAIMSALDTLETDVANETDVVASAVALLDGLHQELADAIASGDPTRVQAVADHLEANTQALADAVQRNTDATEPASPAPTDEG